MLADYILHCLLVISLYMDVKNKVRVLTIEMGRNKMGDIVSAC